MDQSRHTTTTGSLTGTPMVVDTCDQSCPAERLDDEIVQNWGTRLAETTDMPQPTQITKLKPLFLSSSFLVQVVSGRRVTTWGW